MSFYAYLGDYEFGTEPLGTGNKMIIPDLKTARGAIRRCNKYWKGKVFRVYSFTDFYDDSTYRRVH